MIVENERKVQNIMTCFKCRACIGYLVIMLHCQLDRVFLFQRFRNPTLQEDPNSHNCNHRFAVLGYISGNECNGNVTSR